MADNTDLLQQINNYGRANNVPIILDASLPLLCSKIREQGAKRILEIGTAIGYSAIAMASECQVEHITTLELDPKRFAIAQQNIAKSNLNGIIEAINIDAMQYLKSCNNKFDFIFLDGPKGQYIHYLPHLKRILNDGGQIFADNVYFKGMVNGKIPVSKGVKTMINNLRAYLTAVTTDPELKTTVLDTGDGVAISQKIKN